MMGRPGTFDLRPMGTKRRRDPTIRIPILFDRVIYFQCLYVQVEPQRIQDQLH